MSGKTPDLPHLSEQGLMIRAESIGLSLSKLLGELPPHSQPTES
jgi:hypothetical protein